MNTAYFDRMFKTVKMFLLFAVICQVSLMPVSQAFAARHIHDDSLSHAVASAPVYTENIESPFSLKFTAIMLDDAALEQVHSSLHSSFEHNALQSSFFVTLTQPQRSQCGKDTGNTGDCGSCPCFSIISAPITLELFSVFVPTEHFSVRLSSSLYDVDVSPPFRPPTT
jgi:hypothetical protein